MAAIVQYVVIRADLITKLKWPLGAVIAQSCHASTAAIHESQASEDTKSYLADLDNMHKVVLEAKDEKDLTTLAEKLKESNVGHKLWMEQPENFATCLASHPGPKELLQAHFKRFKLYKGPKVDTQ